MRRTSANQVRIIGGRWRSRIIRFPETPGLRPTPDRVRETLFNWLGQDLAGQRCLDLFAGSGALGFEALSRGASSVVMVEKHRNACAALRENAARLNARCLDVVCGDALEFVSARGPGSGMKFDLVFVDAPFGRDLALGALEGLPGRVAASGSVYLESDSKFDGDARWQVRKRGRAGHVHFHLLTACRAGEQVHAVLPITTGAT